MYLLFNVEEFDPCYLVASLPSIASLLSCPNSSLFFVKILIDKIRIKIPKANLCHVYEFTSPLLENRCLVVAECLLFSGH